jgi:hypothetical protein
MTRPEGIATDGLSAFPHSAEVVELHLLLPVRQFTALEAVAARSQLTVATLLRRAIGDFLRLPTEAHAGDDSPGN